MKNFVIKFKKQLTMALLVLVVIGLDQLTKLLVVKNLAYIEQNQPINLIKHLINLTYLENRGAAFGMFSNQRWIFMVISVIAIIGIGVYLFGFCKEGWIFQTGLAFIIGGGIGNMIDRIAYGYVVDMIELDFMEFAIFNVADSFVCVGAGLVILMLIIEIVRDAKKNDAVKAEEDADEDN